MSDNEEQNDAPASKEKDPNVSVSADSDGRETIYVRHPVLPELKKLIIKKGFRILDAAYAPDDAIIYSGSTGKPEGEDEAIDPPTDGKKKQRNAKA